MTAFEGETSKLPENNPFRIELRNEPFLNLTSPRAKANAGIFYVNPDNLTSCSLALKSKTKYSQEQLYRHGES